MEPKTKFYSFLPEWKILYKFYVLNGHILIITQFELVIDLARTYVSNIYLIVDHTISLCLSAVNKYPLSCGAFSMEPQLVILKARPKLPPSPLYRISMFWPSYYSWVVLQTPADSCPAKGLGKHDCVWPGVSFHVSLLSMAGNVFSNVFALPHFRFKYNMSASFI